MGVIGTVQGAGKARSNFAAQHLSAAAFFAGKMSALELENPPSKERFAPEGYAHFWHSSITFSAMAVEANIYDLMRSGERGEPPFAPRRFRLEDYRKPVLARYKLLYRTILNNDPMLLDSGVNQQMTALIALRDEIVHYKSEFRDEAKVSNQLEKRLGQLWSRNPYKCGNVFFPEQCLSVAGAQWSVDIARRFIIEFAQATGLRASVT
jgi:hypothetical protein